MPQNLLPYVAWYPVLGALVALLRSARPTRHHNSHHSPPPRPGPIDHNGTLWYTLDDRKLYKPGETAHVKGVVRHVGVGQAPLPGPPRRVDQCSVGSWEAFSRPGKGKRLLGPQGGLHW